MHKNSNIREVLKIVKERNIRFIKIWFVDILGQLKSFVITNRELEGAFKEGMGFDGSSIEGFARIYESDLVAVPDPITFKILPWSEGEETTAVMFCDILMPNGRNYDGDTRYILKRNLASAKKQGFSYYVGPELEYFYFKNNKTPEILDEGGYFDYGNLDEACDLRKKTIIYAERMGIEVEYSHHEVAPSQHEIDLKYTDALTMADQVITYKAIVKQVAKENGLFASFMPKPVYGVNGSGMHTHMSLFKNGKNAFYNSKDKYHLSDTAKHFLSGIFKHVHEITAITNQWVNSYKRLVPGYEAPVYLCWGRKNRSALIRIPMYKPGKENATRIEVRFPDPACNPYLAFSSLLAAGMEGMRNKYKLPAPVEKDIYHLSEMERIQEKISSLPGSLIEAISFTKDSKLVKNALGEHVFNKFIENKLIEWDRYRVQVTNYEIEKYLPLL